LERLDALAKHLPPLHDADLNGVGLGAAHRDLVTRLTAVLERLRLRARNTMLADLFRLAREQGIEALQLAQTPVAVLLAPMVAELDFDAGRASIQYAREEVQEASLDARGVLEARQKAMDRIRSAALDSAAFFEAIHRAYQMTLCARGLPPEARLDLVDLLGPLAMLRWGPEHWRASDLREAEPYPRALLAYQLQRLRRDGLLEKDAWRIDLGTATGGSARDKRNVLFIPTTPTEGQYHLSIRFLARGSVPAAPADGGTDDSRLA
jgi:hypothetical protein